MRSPSITLVATLSVLAVGMCVAGACYWAILDSEKKETKPLTDEELAAARMQLVSEKRDLEMAGLDAALHAKDTRLLPAIMPLVDSPRMDVRAKAVGAVAATAGINVAKLPIDQRRREVINWIESQTMQMDAKFFEEAQKKYMEEDREARFPDAPQTGASESK